ncbi:MAG: hypothetical protein NTW75_13765 [Planctomycetales bacterium]|nr:hypothetical protein [Planctomycetales bacterium]
MAARTRNTYLQAIRGFCTWCVRAGRLMLNPLARVAKADEKIDRRRQRRAMTEAELLKLLQVARMRPLAEYGREVVPLAAGETEATGRIRKRSSWTKAALTLNGLQPAVERARSRLADNPDFVEKLERIGWERSLIYKTLVLTGLRKGELASLTVGQLELDGPMPCVVLNAADEKNRQGSTSYATARAFVTASDRCSPFQPGWCESSTATFSPPASTRPTSEAEPSTFTLCGIRSERCSARGALLRERLKLRCVTVRST